MRTQTPLTLLGALAVTALAAGAQEVTVASAARVDTTAAARKDSTPETKAAGVLSVVPQQRIQYMRANDARGINVFETTKKDTVPYRGFELQFGGAFTQQFQGLGHENRAQARPVNGVNANQLITLGHGFNNAVANLYVNAQLAKGIRVAMTSYLSARHHQETWVKDGFLQIDASPIDVAPLNTLMNYVTVKAGHFEINYGDAHFRRTDNGNAMYNPLVGNYIMDAFTTQVGGEVYLRGRGRLDGAFVMGGMTNGEIRGTTLNAQRRSPGYLAKAGFDRQVSPDLRVRLTGSTFAQARSSNQTLYSGDRAGSRYYNVVENTASTEKDNFTSGAINPGFNEMHAAVVNPFLKYRGLELFGNFERARGKAAVDTAARRAFTQTAVEGTYRLLHDRVYVSGRYNAVKGQPANYRTDVTIDRTQFGGGWFLNPLILLKGEWVDQKYDGFAPTDIRNGARFRGFVVEGVVAF
ncbi:hypothetical protein [Roseisolibacter sp. H3M3-2]|uniref:hypothetical protein n=1 Tax=Roseisolibacter sp. H3M3-2 TaxID=3031323 RepID=UPI0023DB492C|nr:hypothetical protein [Roseisolibacter sp. H3M3-2]MDF1504004.1 hypothetical protein [Roseisolibacter sp. H3M3-2]